MKINEYQKLAMRTSNENLTKDMHLLNGALGLCGESGEVADIVKKNLMQGHVLDTSISQKSSAISAGISQKRQQLSATTSKT